MPKQVALNTYTAVFTSRPFYKYLLLTESKRPSDKRLLVYLCGQCYHYVQEKFPGILGFQLSKVHSYINMPTWLKIKLIFSINYTLGFTRV